MIQVYSSSYNYNLNFDMPTAIIPAMPRGRPNTQQIKEALATGKLPERVSNDRMNRKKCNVSINDRKKPKNAGKYLVYWPVFFVHRSMGRGYYVYRDRNDVRMQRHGAKAWELSTET